MPNAGVWLVSTMPKTQEMEENVHDDSNGNMLHFTQNIFCYLNILMNLKACEKNKTHRFGLHLGEQVLNHPALNNRDSISAIRIVPAATDRCQLQPHWRRHVHWLLA